MSENFLGMSDADVKFFKELGLSCVIVAGMFAAAVVVEKIKTKILIEKIKRYKTMENTQEINE